MRISVAHRAHFGQRADRPVFFVTPVTDLGRMLVGPAAPSYPEAPLPSGRKAGAPLRRALPTVSCSPLHSRSLRLQRRRIADHARCAEGHRDVGSARPQRISRLHLPAEGRLPADERQPDAERRPLLSRRHPRRHRLLPGRQLHGDRERHAGAGGQGRHRDPGRPRLPRPDARRTGRPRCPRRRRARNDPDVLDSFRGRQVWVDHGHGIVTRYAHLSAIPTPSRSDRRSCRARRSPLSAIPARPSLSRTRPPRCTCTSSCAPATASLARGSRRIGAGALHQLVYAARAVMPRFGHTPNQRVGSWKVKAVRMDPGA